MKSCTVDLSSSFKMFTIHYTIQTSQLHTQQCQFGFSNHIKHLTIKAKQSFYALWILRSHGLLGDCLFDVIRSTTVGKMQWHSWTILHPGTNYEIGAPPWFLFFYIIQIHRLRFYSLNFNELI